MKTQQFNVPLAERYATAVRLLAMRDDQSVPEVLRPVIERFVEAALEADPDLGRALDSMLTARSRSAPSPPIPIDRNTPRLGDGGTS